MSTRDQAYRQFVEDVGDVMDEHGFPHMAGRVVGSLLVCIPPERALDELADDLQASKGSISMATQLLLRVGVIEKVSIPGERRHFYRIQPGFWLDTFARKDEELDRYRQVGEAGLRLLAEEPVESKGRLLEMLAFIDFVAQELPVFVERWRECRKSLLERRMESIA